MQHISGIMVITEKEEKAVAQKGIEPVSMGATSSGMECLNAVLPSCLSLHAFEVYPSHKTTGSLPCMAALGKDDQFRHI